MKLLLSSYLTLNDAISKKYVVSCWFSVTGIPSHNLVFQRESARLVSCLLQVFGLFSSACEFKKSLLSVPLICIEHAFNLLGSDSEARIFWIKGKSWKQEKKEVLSARSSQ